MLEENAGLPGARRRRSRYAVISGSLGVGNLGDDALLAAFLAQHGWAYHGITVLTSRQTRGVPGVWLLEPEARAHLPDSLASVKLASMGGRLGPVRSFSERHRGKLVIQTLADGAPIDYVWLGGLLGHAGHIELRSLELEWARAFAERLVYYFGDAEVRADAHEAARGLAERSRSMPSFFAVRSEAAATELEKFGFPTPQVGTDAVLYHYDRVTVPMAGKSPRVVISPCNSEIDKFRPLWLGMARAAGRRSLPVSWVSLSDTDDLALCRELQAQAGADSASANSSIVGVAGALTALRDATVTLATRFHAHIFSICFGVPTLSVAYAQKARRLFDDLGLSDWRFETAAGDASAQAEALLDRALAGEFAMPEARLNDLRRSHRRVVRAFDATLEA